MRRLLMSVCAGVLASGAAMAQDQAEDWAIVLHGGAGVIERGDMDAETEAAYREALKLIGAFVTHMPKLRAPPHSHPPTPPKRFYVDLRIWVWTGQQEDMK